MPARVEPSPTFNGTLPESLTRESVSALCAQGFLAWLDRANASSLDCSAVRVADGAGLALLWVARQRAQQRGDAFTLAGLNPEIAKQLEQFRVASQEAIPGADALSPAPSRPHPVEALGEGVCASVQNLGERVRYLGEALLSCGALLSGKFRWADFRLAFVRCGVEAVPVVMLIGFLLGLILAFQSAIPLKLFGGEGFVGGLVGIALVRELGLIVTAILMAGRTGSAFAAELGTMKVNEEIDALETMGLHPVRFLALPRILAGTLSLPLLSLFATLAGLLGGWLVMGVLGFSAHYYLDQLNAFVAPKDLIGSTCKAFLFGFAVSAVGCWCGLKAGRDAGAVGKATTSAVVSGIVLLAVLEGILSVVFYAMGW